MTHLMRPSNSLTSRTLSLVKISSGSAVIGSRRPAALWLAGCTAGLDSRDRVPTDATVNAESARERLELAFSEAMLGMSPARRILNESAKGIEMVDGGLMMGYASWMDIGVVRSKRVRLLRKRQSRVAILHHYHHCSNTNSIMAGQDSGSVVLETSMGRVTFELYWKHTPKTCRK